MNTLNIALIQQSCTGNRTDTIAKSVVMIRQGAAQGAELVIMQELHTSLYFCQSEAVSGFDLAEPVPGPSSELFAALAKELGVVIVTSLFERRAAGLYHNTAVILERDGSIAGKYRKMHIPDDPGFYEKYYFTPGDLGFRPVETSVGRLGVMVCWDQWYPEAARLMALAGADILIYPTAIGWDPADAADEKQRQLDAWITIQRSHAVANGIPVVAVNRTGHEAGPAGHGNGIDFWGNSFVAGCQGEILWRSAAAAEEVALINLDMLRSGNVRKIWPFLRDRRIDAYAGILQRYID